MLNQAVIMGRITQEPEIKKLKDSKSVCYITIACTRNYKDTNGEYPTDLIPVKLYMGIAENVAEFCHKGDLIGVKGRLECNDGKLEYIAEKVTFLSNNKGE